MTPLLPRRWWPLGAVVVLLGLAVLATARSSPELGYLAVPPPVEQAIPSRSATPSASPSHSLPPTDAPPGQPVELAGDSLPGWVAPLLIGLCASAIVGLLLVIGLTLVRDRLRRRLGSLRTDEARSGATAAAQVVAALDAGLLDLSDADIDPRRAVIACWLRLEEAAAAAGTPRKPDDTSTDLVTRLLREHSVSADVLTAFASVYREARYTAHTVDETMRTQARSAVARLRGELAVAARA